MTYRQRHATMLAAPRVPGAQEWAIHDYEGFGPLRLSDWESFPAIAPWHCRARKRLAEQAGSPFLTVDIDSLKTDLDIEMNVVESDHHTVCVFDPYV